MDRSVPVLPRHRSGILRHIRPADPALVRGGLERTQGRRDRAGRFWEHVAVRAAGPRKGGRGDRHQYPRGRLIRERCDLLRDSEGTSDQLHHPRPGHRGQPGRTRRPRAEPRGAVLLV
ncbi:unnamed protein product, partial [Ectocarpus sp. 13 AM-2016]